MPQVHPAHAVARRIPGVLALAAALVACSAGAAAALDRNAYLAGYAAAVVERDLGLEIASLVVEDGRARIVVKDLGDVPAQRVVDAIVRVDGIEHVEVSVRDRERQVLASADGARRSESGIQILPRHELFDPLLADPREPHFSAVYQWYLDDDELTHVGSANFGESFALLGGPLGGDARWELGLMGGVFSVFDLDAASSDLVNTDFWVGPTLSFERGRASARLRLFHQSSHLGDEFLLRNRPDRVNLSYEGVDLVGSFQVHPALRVYAGGGVLVHTEPDLDPLSIQAGAELRSPIAFLDDLVRPVAAFDYQSTEENDWREELSTVAGFEIANPEVSDLRLMLLASWFKGNSPNGQFWERRIDLFGLGAHLYF